MEIDTFITALTLQRSQTKGLIAFVVLAVVISSSYRLRSPSETVPGITAADTIVPQVRQPSSVRAIPAEVLEEILNTDLPDSVYYFDGQMD